MLFAYAQPPQTVEEYEAAITEAFQQYEGLSTKGERFQAMADAWLDRALTLEMDMVSATYDAIDVVRGKLEI